LLLPSLLPLPLLLPLLLPLPFPLLVSTGVILSAAKDPEGPRPPQPPEPFPPRPRRPPPSSFSACTNRYPEALASGFIDRPQTGTALPKAVVKHEVRND
jgi:hypothetical protein